MPEALYTDRANKTGQAKITIKKQEFFFKFLNWTLKIRKLKMQELGNEKIMFCLIGGGGREPAGIKE